MIGLERFLEGTGTRAVVAHLTDVRDHAATDLTRAPEHQRLLQRTLDWWATSAANDRALLDRAGPDLAVAQFAGPLPPASVLDVHAGHVARLVADLSAHGWLVPAGSGAQRRAFYRPAIGDAFGVRTAS